MDLQSWLARHGETAQYVAYFTLLVAMGAWERARPARRASAPRGPRWRANFALTALNVLVLGALPTSFMVAAELAASRGVGLMSSAAIPAWLALPVGLLGRGFISWLTHLLMHKVPLLWRIHRVHHTDVELDVSTTVRFHPLELPIGLAIGLPLVIALGLPAWILLAYEVLDAAVTVFSHANVSLPASVERRLRYLLVTPDLHRVHHSVVPEEADSNFSAVFPIWDLVFGTFRLETHAPLATMDLGIEEVRGAPSWSVAWLLWLPLRRQLGPERSIGAPVPLAGHE